MSNKTYHAKKQTDCQLQRQNSTTVVDSEDANGSLTLNLHCCVSNKRWIVNVWAYAQVRVIETICFDVCGPSTDVRNSPAAEMHDWMPWAGGSCKCFCSAWVIRSLNQAEPTATCAFGGDVTLRRTSRRQRRLPDTTAAYWMHSL